MPTTYKKPDMNDIAHRIAEEDGEKVQVNLKQVKKVLRGLKEVVGYDLEAMQALLRYLGKV